MSKLTEILRIENAPREEPRQKLTVRLVKMGAFLRAYDWSAWLLKRYGSPLNVGLDRGGRITVDIRSDKLPAGREL